MSSTASGPIELLAQYLRDLSFEHPDAPHSLNHAGDAVPSVDVDVTFRQIDANVFETQINITATVKAKEMTLAIIELTYAGTYRLPPVAAEIRESFLMVEAPRDLFPFARAIIGMVTQTAGIPPLLIASPNFADVYRASREAKLKTAATA